MGPVHFVPWTFQLNFFSWVSLTCSDTEVQTCRNPSLSKFAYKQRKTTLQPWEDFSTEPPTKQTHKNNSMVSWGWWVKWSDDIFLLKLIPKHEVILFMCSFTFVSVWAVWSAVRSWWNLPSWLCMWEYIFIWVKVLEIHSPMNEESTSKMRSCHAGPLNEIHMNRANFPWGTWICPQNYFNDGRRCSRMPEFASVFPFNVKFTCLPLWILGS